MFSKIHNINIAKNEPLNHHCTFNIGGECDFFVQTKSTNSLIDVIYTCNQHNIPYKVIGNGSNLLFDDNGFKGVIIQYTNDTIQYKDKVLSVSSGADMSNVIQYCLNHDIGGFEFAIGIPCKIGGAIVNNLGAYNHSISDNLTTVTVLRNKHLVFLSKDDCGFDYHSSKIHKKDIILSANFTPPKQDCEVTRFKAQQYINKRIISQPLKYPNAGSVFRRKDNLIPAKLIDNAGLKGLRVGNAQISVKHAGFIVNRGGAKCKDVLTLINLIKEDILTKYNQNLELEIEYLPYTT